MNKGVTPSTTLRSDTACFALQRFWPVQGPLIMASSFQPARLVVLCLVSLPGLHSWLHWQGQRETTTPPSCPQG